MRIYYYSDLHFEENEVYLDKIIGNFNPEPNSILILAGDITHISLIKKDKYLKLLCSKFSETYMICGNHEFFDKKEMQQYANTFYHDFGFLKLVNNYSIKIKDYNFVFSTLFSYISQKYEYSVIRGVYDFKKIIYKSNFLAIKDFNSFNQTSINFITSELIKHSNNIIVTHFPPIEDLQNPFFKNSSLTSYFHNNLNDLLLLYDDKIKYWIYGHNHYNQDLNYSNINLISNQYGYGLNTLANFNYNKYIEI